MEAKALRVGNKVQDNNGFVFDVVSVFKDGTIYCDFEGNEGDVWEFDNNNPCQEIELTEEMLLRCEKITKTNGYPYKMLNGFLKIRNGVFFFKYYDLEIELPYLHQLQNLYYALCNEELNIKL